MSNFQRDTLIEALAALSLTDGKLAKLCLDLGLIDWNIIPWARTDQKGAHPSCKQAWLEILDLDGDMDEDMPDEPAVILFEVMMGNWRPFVSHRKLSLTKGQEESLEGEITRTMRDIKGRFPDAADKYMDAVSEICYLVFECIKPSEFTEVLSAM